MSTALARAQQFARDLAGIVDAAGEAATVRRYVSESGGTPWAGQTATPTVVERRIRLLNVHSGTLPELRELAEAGGTLQAGDQVAHVAAGTLADRDEVVLDGAAWRVVGRPRPHVLYGQRYDVVVLRRAGQ